MKVTKKIISALLSSILLLLGAAGAYADDAEVSIALSPLYGKVIELHEDGGMIVETLDDQKKVEVARNEFTTETADWVVGEGDIVIVAFEVPDDAKALPDQVTATHISSFAIDGIITEMNDSRIAVETPDAGLVWVMNSESLDTKGLAEGDAVRIYYSGIMALSEPPQVPALEIRKLVELRGVVTEAIDETTLEEGSDAYFLMEAVDGTVVHVNYGLHTKRAEAVEVGEEVTVYYSGIMTRSMPGQIYAIAIYK